MTSQLREIVPDTSKRCDDSGREPRANSYADQSQHERHAPPITPLPVPGPPLAVTMPATKAIEGRLVATGLLLHFNAGCVVQRQQRRRGSVGVVATFTGV